ncbi:MBL fold metallo-hydrolase [Mycolicibacterium vaccae]|uniref:Beta-lactamase domain-containing protein n=1 Tax=Mycolicibacterium vaccae ATCC 25954 TaxID=1194972 RepID=K0UNE4_MYCVA|nr:MBL fold metallo-hydrolase [Mycolicibacterium vaccae]ANI37797.1 beta-lactamase [Mycolicibacterium vaccae 95051]EJZ08707.1 beta-lactamase domain-containing protein [Mycolicibacterium vaccae ATCC 25954]MCV7060807.1 MBL fold metallo-hydrolase [Mycolicibacterium vaccae]
MAAGSARLVRITETVHFAQTDLVNWTLVTGGPESGGGVLLIDAGYPGHRDEVVGSVRELGFRPEDVRAILLTHAHIDHFGSAIWFAREHGTPVYCHRDEVGHSRREYLEQASPLAVAAQAWRPRWLKWTVALIGKGGLDHTGIPTTAALTDEIAAGLPGTPRCVPTPGHTGGHCSYLVDGVLVSGDALVTGHPVSTRRGPQLLPSVFNHDEDACRRSLDALGTVDAEVMLPGHGPVWRGSLRDAANQARLP